MVWNELDMYQMKPIAFRWTGTSSTHDQLFFWVSWKIRANEFGRHYKRR